MLASKSYQSGPRGSTTNQPTELTKLTSKGKDQYSGAVCTNWPSSVGSCCCFEKTGASVVSPFGLQKALVVQSVRGQGMASSFRRANMFLYSYQKPVGGGG